jgi:tRNA pseudouridine55 synthase
MDGILLVDKPSGPTSHDVVARVRAALGTGRVGHTGTLDPMATGLLVLLIGRGTRLARFFTGAVKGYDAHIRLGWATSTFDATGAAQPGPATTIGAGVPGDLQGFEPPGREAVEEALVAFRGTYEQLPPPFSAKKVDGIRAHELARHGKQVPLTPTRVTVHELTIRSLEGGILRLEVRCSAGFYVRVLAHDIGRRLGTGAHLAALRRTRCGEFSLDRAVPLEVIEREGAAALERIETIDALLPSLPAVVLTGEGARRAAHGNEVRPCDAEVDRGEFPAARARLVDGKGRLLAVADPQVETGSLHPVVVLV